MAVARGDSVGETKYNDMGVLEAVSLPVPLVTDATDGDTFARFFVDPQGDLRMLTDIFATN